MRWKVENEEIIYAKELSSILQLKLNKLMILHLSIFADQLFDSRIRFPFHI